MSQEQLTAEERHFRQRREMPRLGFPVNDQILADRRQIRGGY